MKYCIVCNGETSARDRCTNCCCPECHRLYCSAGGEVSVGHCLNLTAAMKAHDAKAKAADEFKAKE